MQTSELNKHGELTSTGVCRTDRDKITKQEDVFQFYCSTLRLEGNLKCRKPVPL